ncbi:indolethylamine N-methyltransferase-like [Rhinophrynus dorsalis]
MDSSPHKNYHEHEFDPNHLLYTYLSNSAAKGIRENIYMYPMEKIHIELASGRVRGNTLIDISFGPNISHLLAVCEFFNEITVLESNELCIKELEKWINKEPDAFDWSHALAFASGLKGSSNQWQETEDKLRKTIKHIRKCDFTKENPIDPVVLEKADCVLIVWGLTAISKDYESFCSNMKKIASMLKLGGHLIMFGSINTSYFVIGDQKYHALSINEESVTEALRDAGFAEEYFELKGKMKGCQHVFDTERLFSVTAVKEREV